MSEVVNVINLKFRPERLELFEQQAKEQGFSYKIWEGIVDPIVFKGINLAHKEVIKYAKATGKKMVVVCEDDIKFVGGNGAFDYFMANVPDDFDLYLGMVYQGRINEENRIVPDALSFSGMTIYVCHERFYNDFLNMNPVAHIDKEIGKFSEKFKYIVCDKFIAKQYDGYSDQKKKHCKYDHLLKGRKMFGG